MRIFILFAATALSVGFYAPAIAQQAMKHDHMSSGSSMHMWHKHMKTMHKCKAMSHDMMMKNAGCKKMMKMHPDMMSGDAMTPGH